MSQALNFVLCPSYHGATLFGLLANNHSAVAHLGDTLPIQRHMDYFCSCQERIQDCEFWSEMTELLGTRKFPHEKKIVPVAPRILKSTEQNQRLARTIIKTQQKLGFSAWTFMPWRVKEFIRVTEDLATHALRLQNKKVFVDGSKEVYRVMAYWALAKPDKLRIIHLVRDPRAFVLSSLVNLADRNITPEHAIQIWKNYHNIPIKFAEENPQVEYLRVRYEDISADPDGEMARVFNFIGLEPEIVAVAPKQPHHLIGNRMLLEFDGTVKLDTRWETELSEETQTTILKSTEELSKLFGYAE